MALVPCVVAAGLAAWTLDAELKPPRAQDNPWAPPAVLPAQAPSAPTPKRDDLEPWETVPT